MSNELEKSYNYKAEGSLINMIIKGGSTNSVTTTKIKMPKGGRFFLFKTKKNVKMKIEIDSLHYKTSEN